MLFRSLDAPNILLIFKLALPVPAPVATILNVANTILPVLIYVPAAVYVACVVENVIFGVHVPTFCDGTVLPDIVIEFAITPFACIFAVVTIPLLTVVFASVIVFA